MKIPKEIVDKIELRDRLMEEITDKTKHGYIPEDEIMNKMEQRKRLIKEISKWCEDNLDIEGMDPRYADITDYHTGNEQGIDEGKEWCNQKELGEDWFCGEYYWETEYEGKYLHMSFEI